MCFATCLPLSIRNALVLLLCLTAMVAADPTDGGGTAKVRFRAQGVPDSRSTAVDAVAMRQVLKVFLAENPQVEIVPFSMPSVGAGGMDTGPLMGIAAGIPPHAIYVNFRQSSSYLAQGFLEPIESLLVRVLSDDPRLRQTDAQERWVVEPSQTQLKKAIDLIRERTPAQAWPVVYRADESGRSKDKHVWAVPTASSVMALLYRKDLFNEAGLDPEQPPRTWDEFLQTARALTVPERQQYGFSIALGRHLSWSIYTFLVSNGARAVAEKDGEWYATYGDRQAAEAVEYVWRLTHEPFERDGQIIDGAVSVGTSSQAWEQGKLGMKFGYLHMQMLADLNPQLVGIAPVPVAPGGGRGSEVNCQMLGVFADSTPQQKLAVMRYIWFITGERAKRIRTQVYVDNGYGRFMNPQLLERFGYDRILKQVPPGWQEVFETAMAHGVPEPYGRNTQNIYTYMSKPIEAALELDFAGVPHEQRIQQIQELLEDSARTVNEKVLGNITPEEMRKRRVFGGIALAFIIAAFVYGFSRIWKHFTVVSAAGREGPMHWRKYAWGYALIAPSMVLVIGWMYIPLLWGAGLALTDYRLVLENTFVGVDNFANVLFDEVFWLGLWRTFYFVVLMIGLGFWPPILLAILLDEVPTATFKYVFRTLYYMPAIVSGVIVMFLWKELFDPSPYGTLNQVLLLLNRLDPVSATLIKWFFAACWAGLVGLLLWLPIAMKEMSLKLRALVMLLGIALAALTLWPVLGPLVHGRADSAAEAIGSLVGRFELEPLRWIRSPELAMLCVVIPTIWAGSGPGCLLYLAALKTIPEDLYEAAEIDGANIWHRICYITLPRLKYLITIQFVAAVIGTFQGGANMILVLTGGGPNDSTTILALEIFFRTFIELKFGIGSAMAWLLGAMLIGFTAYQLKLLSRAEFQTARSA